jgi:hypothetical protein
MRRQIISGISITAICACALVAGTGVARAGTAACDSTPLSQPFAPWGDPASYGLLANGGFEQGRSSWTLDDAHVVDGNESFFVTNPADSSSLDLGDSGTATSDPACVSIQDPTLRFFVRNTGSPLSLLQVSVLYTTDQGNQVSVPVGLIAAGSDWQPSPQTPVVLNLLSVAGPTDVSFQFTPKGDGGNWSIDDVYLDPFKTK